MNEINDLLLKKVSVLLKDYNHYFSQKFVCVWCLLLRSKRFEFFKNDIPLFSLELIPVKKNVFGAPREQH